MTSKEYKNKYEAFWKEYVDLCNKHKCVVTFDSGVMAIGIGSIPDGDFINDDTGRDDWWRVFSDNRNKLD